MDIQQIFANAEVIFLYSIYKSGLLSVVLANVNGGLTRFQSLAG